MGKSCFQRVEILHARTVIAVRKEMSPVDLFEHPKPFTTKTILAVTIRNGGGREDEKPYPPTTKSSILAVLYRCHSQLIPTTD